MAAAAFRSFLSELMEAKASGEETGALLPRGAAHLIALRAEQTDAALAAAVPHREERQRVEAAEEEVRCLQYARARAAQGIAEARREAETLRLPDGLVSASEAAAIAARNGAPLAREPHGEMLQRLVVEHDERIRLGAQREEVQAEKRRRVGTTAAQRALAAASRTQLDTILFAAQGLKTELTAPPPHEPVYGAERAAALPDPLFCLWRAAVALLSAWATGGEEAPAAPLPTLTIDDLLAPEDASLFAPEPLGVALRAPGDGCVLSFSYHANPHMIGVTALGPHGTPLPAKLEQRLRTLFPDDDARGLPDERCLLLAQGPGGQEQATDGVGAELSAAGVEAMGQAMPFRWAQWMGGIGPPLGDGREVHSFAEVLKALCAWLNQVSK